MQQVIKALAKNGATNKTGILVDHLFTENLCDIRATPVQIVHQTVDPLTRSYKLYSLIYHAPN